MFHHVVLMRLSGIDAEFHSRVAAYAERVRSELPNVRSYAFVPNSSARSAGYDWAVLSAFDTVEDHDRYQDSAVHREMKTYMTPFIDDLIACDIDMGRQG
ncbi:MAG: Dabb family protein [Roseovarius sp.]|nr:Dabb family protein [Roseovarius sp.]